MGEYVIDYRCTLINAGRSGIGYSQTGIIKIELSKSGKRKKVTKQELNVLLLNDISAFREAPSKN